MVKTNVSSKGGGAVVMVDLNCTLSKNNLHNNKSNNEKKITILFIYNLKMID